MRRRTDRDEGGYGLAFETRVLAARLNLLVEGIWRHGRIFFCLAGLLIALSLLDLWSFTGDFLHVLALCLFVGAAGYSLYSAIRSFVLPTRPRALAYLERRNHLRHRPLQSLGDTSAAENFNNTASSRMWRIHQKTLRKSVRGVRAGFPKLDMGLEDTYGIRALVILLVFLAFVVAGPLAADRLVAGFTPSLGTPTPKVEVTAWITPPHYTGQAPILLKVDETTLDEGPALSYVVPTGSTFVARVFGGKEGTPSLVQGTERQDFDRLDSRNFEFETTFTTTGELKIEKDGDIAARWDLNVIEDELPTISLLVPPQVTERSAFHLQYRATDDYGISQIGAEISRRNSDEKITLNLPAPGRGTSQVVGKSYHDLTAHPWAGLDVELVLLAEDQLGQKGQSEVTVMVLPERIFTHPIAKALIEQRRNLVADPDLNKPNAIIALAAISLIPEALNDDYVAIMLLSTAQSLLTHGGDQQAIDDVVDLLWDTALRLENGDLSMAEAALRAAEQALMEALNNDASDAEIKALVDELRTAMDNFLEALAAQQQDTASQSPADPNSDQRTVNRDGLQNLLDKIDQFARNGARDAARQLLSELQDIMENLQNAQRGQPSQSQQAQQQMLNELGDLMRRQQELLDETFRQSQEQQNGQQQQDGQQQQSQNPGQSGGQGKNGLEGLATGQEALRQMLGDLMGRLGEKGEIPQSLGRAERSMNEARKSLEQGQGKGAQQSEGEALENMRQGAEAMAQQMMENGQGQGGPSTGMQQGQGRDPLGRQPGQQEGSQGRGMDTGALEGATDAFNKTRSIRSEVQRRLSDPSRGVLEREYLKRLLDFF
ncbi:TIGR02302 family protein [Sneathiella marina]|uniref:TIGR02302 family protein n=1 Tax=Sneathiella marina TaxID=2950108 RepID=A0ABY4W2Q7_9PROT|nr:TIGR02302 family protein [Sneathiella marina]USG61124.1 TIGR02302 family protein [Sneathiella marina]